MSYYYREQLPGRTKLTRRLIGFNIRARRKLPITRNPAYTQFILSYLALITVNRDASLPNISFKPRAEAHKIPSLARGDTMKLFGIDYIRRRWLESPHPRLGVRVRIYLTRVYIGATRAARTEAKLPSERASCCSSSREASLDPTTRQLRPR